MAVEEEVELGRVRDHLFVVLGEGAEGERERERERGGAAPTTQKKKNSNAIAAAYLVDDRAGHDVAAAVCVARVAGHGEHCCCLGRRGERVGVSRVVCFGRNRKIESGATRANQT